MRQIVMLLIMVFLSTSSFAKKPNQDSIDQIVVKLSETIKHVHPYRLFRKEFALKFEAVQQASLSVRKKYYRSVVYFLIPKIHTSWEYRRVGKLSFFDHFDNDYSHFYKYLNKLEIGEVQRFFKYYQHIKCSKSKYRALPLDVARLKNDDRKLYLIAHAQFNLLKSGRPLRKARWYY